MLEFSGNFELKEEASASNGTELYLLQEFSLFL